MYAPRTISNKTLENKIKPPTIQPVNKYQENENRQMSGFV
jgi:hypothetical protein